MVYKDRQGNEISANEWARLFDDSRYQVLRLTELPNGFRLALVWLGYDNGDGKIFELQVYPPNAKQPECIRHADEASAQNGYMQKFDELHPENM